MGSDHLSEADYQVIAEVFGRKTGAFLAANSPKTCVRAFKHDTVVSGPPVRGHPIKHNGAESVKVEGNLEK